MAADSTTDGEPLAASDVDRALALLNRAEGLRAEAASLLGQLADTGLAQWLGYVSLERLVAHRTGCRNSTAAAFVGVARFLDRFALSATALQSGQVNWAHVETLARAAAGDRAGQFANYEAELLAAAEGSSPEEFDRIVNTWRARVDAQLDVADAERVWRQRSLTLQLAFDGSSHGRFRLDPIATEIVAAALETPPDPVHAFPTPDIPPALRRAVQIRDRRCTFKGCDRPHHWCDLHHIVPRNRGGPTTAQNLTLLCRFHHGCVHDGGWQLSRAPDGTIQVTSP